MQEIHIVDIRNLTEVIKTKYGYDFTNYAISSFKRRILRIIGLYKFNNVDALTKKISDDPSFFEEFISEITVNVTEMFRDPSFWRVLRDEIIPNILLNHKKLSIWHAGCSTGQEVYSMLILLEEMDLLEKAKIYATDINTDVINSAYSGEYKYRFNIGYLDNFDKVVKENPYNYEEYNDVPYSKYFKIDKISDSIQNTLHSIPQNCGDNWVL